MRGRPRGWRRGGWWRPASAAFSLVYFSEIKDAARDLLGLQAPSGAQTRGGQALRPRRPAHAEPSPRGRIVEIRAGAYGHYYASVEINGRSVDVMVDTGASIVALTFDDAERAGLYIRDSDYTQRVNTANGLARIAPVMLDRVSIGDITVRNVPAAVSEPGKLSTSLLGMSFLSRLQRVDMRSGVLVLAGVGQFPAGASTGRHGAFAGEPAPALGVVRCGCDNPAERSQGVLMTLPKPRADLKPNTADFERLPLVKPTGFREYDARWLYPQEINLMGLNAIGLGLATLAGRRGVPKRFVVGHDYRSYSAAVKQASMTGLLAGGAEVHDIGLALSPMAYFAQFALDVEGVAMVTASHNDNGWTGIKMGFQRPLTFGPDEMTALKEIVLGGECRTAPGGRYVFVPDMAERYIAALDRPAEAEAQAQGGRGLRQRHGRRLGAEGAGGHRLRGGPARLRARLHLSALQPEPRRHEDAARHRRRGARAQGRCRLRLRRRRRPLRRGRQRRGTRSSPTRSASCWRAISRPARASRVRRRREIDRPVHDRSGAAWPTARARSTGRPATPT